jgi:hypothetical protein
MMNALSHKEKLHSTAFHPSRQQLHSLVTLRYPGKLPIRLMLTAEYDTAAYMYKILSIYPERLT